MSDDRLAYFEWSVDEDAYLAWVQEYLDAARVGRQVRPGLPGDPEDPATWAQANPALGIRISPEFVRAEMAALGGPASATFARERLGVGTWPAADGDGWEVVSSAAWAACADPSSELLDPVAFSLDTTPDRSWTSIGAAGRRADGLVHLEVVEHRPGTDWAPARAAELVERWAPCVFVADESGPAASLAPALARTGVAVTAISGREVAAGCAHLLDLVAGGRARHLGQPELSAALQGARRREIGDKSWAWARRGIDVVISPLVAVTQAAYGFEVHGGQAFFGTWR